MKQLNHNLLAFIGWLIIFFSLGQLILMPLDNNFLFWLWRNFMGLGHQFFSGFAFIYISKCKLKTQMFNIKIWFIVGACFFILSLFFRLSLGWSFWSSLFLISLYILHKTKIDKFFAVYLSFLITVIMAELWELPIYIKQVIMPPNPSKYTPFHIVDVFLFRNTKLWSVLLLVMWASYFGWKPTKLFVITSALCFFSYFPIILTDLGWTAWWYRIFYVAFSIIFLLGFPKYGKSLGELKRR